MKNVRYFLVVAFLIMAGCASYPAAGVQPSAPSLDEKTLSLINDAVYEVVVLKPTKDSLKYEKPLPMDLIPYAIRTDKYYPVGTAFAIGPDRFVSAAHVMNLDDESQFKEVFLRDKDKNVYSIDKITKYADHRDFVVFSLKNRTAKQFFPVNTKLRINEKVYAVGNALGQGVVVRDGLYTSNTPEEEEGEWQWMRFSAAASPGNSGGPLLDKDGNVVGIVLGKSANENLNYALPLSEVMNAKANTATVQKKMKYFLDNMDMTKMGTLKKEFPLPKSYDELNKELVTTINQYADKLLKDLLAENKDAIFPRGKGSTILLNSTIGAVSPHLIIKGDDGNWDAFHPKETHNAELENNGYLVYGKLGNSIFLYVRKPDDIGLDRLYKDTKLFMDLLLKGIYIPREIGSEKIKITSMGKAHEDYTYKDNYGRKWLVRTWLLEYSDEKIVTFSLPVPGGCITMMRAGQTGTVDNGHIPDLKVLTDFIYVSYYGTLKQWKEFLTMKDMLPSAFSTIDIAFDYNKSVTYRSKRLSFSYTPDVMEIVEKSPLELLFTYFNENGKVVWDVGDIFVGEDKSNDTGFAISRTMKPPKELSDNYQSKWENITKQKFPYNASAYYEDKSTSISTVYLKNITGSGGAKSASVLYTVWHGKEGKIEQKEMEEKLNKIVKNLTIYEGATTAKK